MPLFGGVVDVKRAFVRREREAVGRCEVLRYNGEFVRFRGEPVNALDRLLLFIGSYAVGRVCKVDVAI